MAGIITVHMGGASFIPHANYESRQKFYTRFVMEFHSIGMLYFEQ